MKAMFLNRQNSQPGGRPRFFSKVNTALERGGKLTIECVCSLSLVVTVSFSNSQFQLMHLIAVSCLIDTLSNNKSNEWRSQLLRIMKVGLGNLAGIHQTKATKLYWECKKIPLYRGAGG